MAEFKNKNAIMSLSALLILVFHLWIPVFAGSGIEQFLVKTAYIGVDMFFFVSAFAVGRKNIDDYKDYVIKRFKGVYFKFVILAIIGAVYAKLKWQQLLKTVLFVELFQKGGGAFLWFLPAIMLMYILLPLYQKLFNKIKIFAPITLLVIWLIVGSLVSNLTDYNEIFIFWNRIPIILFGYHAPSFFLKLKDKHWQKVILCFIMLAVGVPLLYLFGYKVKVSEPIWDMFYICAIPVSFGLVLLADFIPENKFINLFGSSTLEMYGLQMIFGYTLANKIYRLTSSAIATNIIVILLITAISVAISSAWKYAVSKKKS